MLKLKKCGDVMSQLSPEKPSRGQLKKDREAYLRSLFCFFS